MNTFPIFPLGTIDRLARRHRLKLFDVEQIPTHGGSLRVYLTHDQASHRPLPQVAALLDHERALGFETIDTYMRFAPQVHQAKRKLLKFLIECKDQGATLCGYGAPGKGNTLLNYCGIGT